jgi:hypothetical protein
VLAASGSVYRARPDHEVRDFGWSSNAATEAGDVAAELECQLNAGCPDAMMSQLAALGRDLWGSRQELALVAQERADELNQDAPQVG